MQEREAAKYLSQVLGPAYDISCSASLASAGFLERENAAILNASIRRFAKRLINKLAVSLKALTDAQLFITLNDGTISHASLAAQRPIRCFSSGPTNSARGAALLAGWGQTLHGSEDHDVLVIDVGGTTTDVCTLLPSGYPKQSCAFIKVSGVRTNFSMPDVHSVGLGGGSIIRIISEERVTVGPDSVGADAERQSLSAGGDIFTVS
jgi:N-methylhydantoinase A/oxoprolinase/acetone carboxylase beta subunit